MNQTIRLKKIYITLNFRQKTLINDISLVSKIFTATSVINFFCQTKFITGA